MKPPRSKKVSDSNEGILSSFVTHLEHAKYDKRMTNGKQLELVEASEIVKSFSHRGNPYKQFIIVHSMEKWQIWLNYHKKGAVYTLLVLTYHIDSISQDPHCPEGFRP